MDIEDVLKDVQKEVKRAGDDVKSLTDNLTKDLADVRKLAEEAKSAVDPELKKKLEAITTGVAEKHAAIEALVKEIKEKAIAGAESRMDEIERKINRNRLLPGLGGDDEMKSLRDFSRIAKAQRGELKYDTDTSDESIDVEGIKAYGKQFSTYLRKGDASLQGAEAKTMLVGSDPDGGFLVTPYMSPRILTKIYESSPMRAIATVETIGTDAVEYPIDDDEAGYGWVGETETRSETSTPRTGVQKIPVYEIYAKPKATQKLLDDASIDVEAWLSRKVGERFGRVEASAFVTGDGIKKPRGFTTYSAGTTRGTIERVASGHATEITSDSLIRLMIALKEGYAAGAVWAMRRATVGNVMLLKDLNDQYVWRPGLEAGKPSILLGHEVNQFADMPAVAAGALAVAFGNFRQGYTVVDRAGISTLRDPFSAKPFVEFYSRKRVGGDVTDFEAIKLLEIAAS